MNKLKQLNKKKWFIVLVILLAIALVGGLGTYAMFFWRSTNNTELTLKIGDIADVTFPQGQELNTNNLTPVFNYTDGEQLTFSIKNKDQTGAIIRYNVKFNITNIDEELANTSLKYKIVLGNSVVGDGDFSSATSNNTINLCKGKLASGTSNYTLYLYIDSNIENNPNMMNKNIRGTIEVTARETNETNLVDHITNLYDNAEKTVVTANSELEKDGNGIVKYDEDNNFIIKTINFNYATSVNLMNDRLGGTTSSLDGGNIRYYGANPNNYIDIGDKYETDDSYNVWEKELNRYFENIEECQNYFNCSTNYEDLGFESEEDCNTNFAENIAMSWYSVETSSNEDFINTYCKVETIPAGTPILWRIIGIFDDKIKIIRDKGIGNYSYDTSVSEETNYYGPNEWSQADLMKLLNPGYDDNMDLNDELETIAVNNSLWWNSESGKCYVNDYDTAETCDFTNTGLSNEAKNLIVDNLWNLGGINYDYDGYYEFSNGYYNFERGNDVIQNPSDGITRTTKWVGKVGLIYPSDYGYAADLSICKERLGYYYKSANCTGSDWLNNDDYYYIWTITPYSHSDTFLMIFTHRGSIGVSPTSSADYVRPVVYLKQTTEIVSGQGTKTEPYKVR